MEEVKEPSKYELLASKTIRSKDSLLFLSQQQKHLIETTWGKVDCLRLIVSNDSVFHVRESVVEQSNPQWDVGRKFRKCQGNTQFSRTCPPVTDFLQLGSCLLFPFPNDAIIWIHPRMSPYTRSESQDLISSGNALQIHPDIGFTTVPGHFSIRWVWQLRLIIKKRKKWKRCVREKFNHSS